MSFNRWLSHCVNGNSLNLWPIVWFGLMGFVVNIVQLCVSKWAGRWMSREGSVHEKSVIVSFGRAATRYLLLLFKHIENSHGQKGTTQNTNHPKMISNTSSWQTNMTRRKSVSLHWLHNDSCVFALIIIRSNDHTHARYTSCLFPIPLPMLRLLPSLFPLACTLPYDEFRLIAYESYAFILTFVKICKVNVNRIFYPNRLCILDWAMSIIHSQCLAKREREWVAKRKREWDNCGIRFNLCGLVWNSMVLLCNRKSNVDGASIPRSTVHSPIFWFSVLLIFMLQWKWYFYSCRMDMKLMMLMADVVVCRQCDRLNFTWNRFTIYFLFWIWFDDDDKFHVWSHDRQFLMRFENGF